MWCLEQVQLRCHRINLHGLKFLQHSSTENSKKKQLSQNCIMVVSSQRKEGHCDSHISLSTHRCMPMVQARPQLELICLSDDKNSPYSTCCGDHGSSYILWEFPFSWALLSSIENAIILFLTSLIHLASTASLQRIFKIYSTFSTSPTIFFGSSPFHTDQYAAIWFRETYHMSFLRASEGRNIPWNTPAWNGELFRVW